MDKNTGRQKIIQKKVRRKERFARMARNRHRKEKGALIAKPEALSNIEKAVDRTTVVYHCSPGMMLGERDGRIVCEPSMLNKSYIGNDITIIQDDIKLIQLRLAKYTSDVHTITLEDLENWKKREDPSWTEWAERVKKFTVTYNNFLMKHKDKYTADKLEEGLVNRYKAYEQLKKELMTTKNAIEMKIRFDLEGDYMSEMTFNSIFIENMGYEIQEFIDSILRGGIPLIKHTENDKAFYLGKIIDNFEALFENTLAFQAPEDFKLVGKDKKIKLAKQIMYASGYFLKGRAELSYIITSEEYKSLRSNKSLLHELNIPVVKQNIEDKLERRAFLDKYYNDGVNKLICKIKELDVNSTEGEEDNTDVSVKIDIEIKEELSDDRSGYKLEYF